MALLEARVDTSELERLIARFRASTKSLAPTMEIVAEMLVAAVDDRYESEGDGEWPPHSKAYAKRKGVEQLMQRSGVLAGSTRAGHGENFAEASTGIGYIVYHLEGGPIMPKRNPFEIPEDVFDEAERFISETMAKKLGG